MKKILLSLLVIFGIMVLSGAGAVTVETAAAGLPSRGFDVRNAADQSVSPVVSGTPGTALTEKIVRIDLNGAKIVREIPKDKDVTSWIRCVNGTLPSGIRAGITSGAKVNDAYFDVTIYGTTYTAIWDEFYFVIPEYYLLENGDEFVRYDVKPEYLGKFNIVRATTDINNTGVVTFQSSKVVIEGETGKAITQKELTLTFDGVFVRSLTAGQDVTSWFRGKGVSPDGMVTSFIPAGLKVTVKSKVNLYSNSITLVFSGTPTEASLDAVSFTIPQGYAALKSTVKKCETKDEFTTPVYNGINDPII